MQSIAKFALFLSLLVVGVSGRTLCYSGSDLYQRLTIDCDAQDPAWSAIPGNTWYCATIEVCEQYKPESRACMTTRGCAKADQCKAPGGGLYDGSAIVNTDTKQSIAGMTLKPKCCLNANSAGGKDGFANDDGALDYDIICNSAGKGIAFSASMTLAIIVGISVSLGLI